MYAVMAYFHHTLSSQRGLNLWRSFCVMLIAKNRKYSEIRKSELVGGISIIKTSKKSQILQWQQLQNLVNLKLKVKFVKFVTAFNHGHTWFAFFH